MVMGKLAMVLMGVVWVMMVVKVWDVVMLLTHHDHDHG